MNRKTETPPFVITIDSLPIALCPAERLVAGLDRPAPEDLPHLADERLVPVGVSHRGEPLALRAALAVRGRVVGERKRAAAR